MRTEPDIDWRAIALMVADGLRIASGDRVSVFVTDTAVMDAARAFVDVCWQRGAVPQVLATDEKFDDSALRFASWEVLAQAPPLEVAAMEWSDVHVSFRAMTRPAAGSSPERIAALRHARGIVSTMRWQRTRWAIVRVPTAEWAVATGVDPDRLFTEWRESFQADWADGAVRMGHLCRRLDECSTVVIDDGWGTLELPTAGRTWVPFSGTANWPDGEIATAPLEDEVRGRICFPGRFAFAGTWIRDLELEFEDGAVVRESAAEGIELVSRLLDTDEGARRVGELGIGTNAALRTMTGDLLIDEKILGTVHIALGRAYPECGGVNQSALHWDIVKDLRIKGRSGSVRADAMWLVHDGSVEEPLRSAAVAGGSV